MGVVEFGVDLHRRTIPITQNSAQVFVELDAHDIANEKPQGFTLGSYSPALQAGSRGRECISISAFSGPQGIHPGLVFSGPSGRIQVNDRMETSSGMDGIFPA